jgi:hypothetical protein
MMEGETMKIEVTVPEYSREHGLAPLAVEPDTILGAGMLNEKVFISGNKAGLMSLAIHLLALAQDDVPVGRDILYGAWNWLAPGSTPVLIRKIEADEDALPRPLEGEARERYQRMVEHMQRGMRQQQEDEKT